MMMMKHHLDMSGTSYLYFWFDFQTNNYVDIQNPVCACDNNDSGYLFPGQHRDFIPEYLIIDAHHTYYW